jgi:hypothetical protein
MFRHRPGWSISSTVARECFPVATRCICEAVNGSAGQRDEGAFCPTESRFDMSSPSTDRDLRTTSKQIEILVVESNPADTHLTEIAFKAAGLTSGFRSVSDREDALEARKVRGRLHARSDISRSLASKSLWAGKQSKRPLTWSDSSCFWVRRPRTRQSCLRAEWQQLHAQAA